jgi:hypothetical protein
MTTATIKGFVYHADYGYGEPEFRILGSDKMSDQHYTLVGPLSIEYEVPADFNPTAAKLAALEAEKQKVRAAYLERVREIERRIANLQALEMTVEAA